MTEKKPGCGKLILETERLLLREMTQADLDALCKILCDEDVLCAPLMKACLPGRKPRGGLIGI